MSVDYFTPDPSDADALAALHVACWKETYGEILPAEIIDKLSVAEKAAMWRGVIADAGVFKLAVRKDGVLAGFVICGPVRDGAGLGGDGEILAVYLLKAAQGHGIGRELLARSAAFWRGQGGSGLIVLSLQANRGAAAFYEALGAKKVHSGSIDMGGAVACDHAHLFADLPALAELGVKKTCLF